MGEIALAIHIANSSGSCQFSLCDVAHTLRNFFCKKPNICVAMGWITDTLATENVYMLQTYNINDSVGSK